MVVFTCEACNESLKKNKVEEHLYRCRRARHVTCIDCQVDFDRESYKVHTSCISEVEKYSGPGYVAKASANKGAKKQDDWFQRVQSAIDSCSGAGGNQQLAGVLRKVRESANVPRKQAKFVNFCRNSMKWAGPSLVQQAWSLLAEGAAAQPPQENEKQKKGKNEETGQPEATDEAVEVTKKNKKKRDEETGQREETEAAALDVEEQKTTKKKKKKRRSRVEETDQLDDAEEAVEADDQRKARDEEDGQQEEAEEQKTKKKKKKSRGRVEETDQHEVEAEVAAEANELQNAKEKKKKKRHRQAVDDAGEAGGDSGEQSQDREKKKKKRRRQDEESSEVAELDTSAISVA